MTESDDSIFNPPTIDKSVNPAREVITDPDLLDPQRKKKKSRRQASIVAADFALPLLSDTGVLGFGDEA